LQEIVKRVSACQEQLKESRAELDVVAKKKAAIMAALEKVVDEGHPHYQALMAIFNRKIKRSKKKVNEDNEDDSEEDEIDDDDFDDDESQEICPPGCDQAIYDEVLLGKTPKILMQLLCTPSPHIQFCSSASLSIFYNTYTFHFLYISLLMFAMLASW
jgi:hypothetical protein